LSSRMRNIAAGRISSTLPSMLIVSSLAIDVI